MTNIKKILTLTVVAFSLQFIFVTTYSSNVFALDPCDTTKDGENTKICKTDATSLSETINRVINILLTIAGIVAVLMIVIGGLRYITSDGDSGRITQAKQTVLYAIIGLIVAILAYAIVNFVLGRI